jgi:hypothetical protein
MTKKQACDKALSEVSELFRFGNQWKYLVYDEFCEAWRESIGADYHLARYYRRVALIERAKELLYPDRIDGHLLESGDYFGGSWKSYV